MPLVAVEIECLAAAARHCRFIMAPPARIEGHLARYRRGAPRARTAAGAPHGGRASRVLPAQAHGGRAAPLARAAGAARARAHGGADRRQRGAAARRWRSGVRPRRRATEFLSVAAHELKTPLTSLRGFAQLLTMQFEEGKPPDQRRLVKAPRHHRAPVEKLSVLVSQLLDVSRLQAGRLVLERKRTDVVALARHVRGGRAPHPRPPAPRCTRRAPSAVRWIPSGWSRSSRTWWTTRSEVQPGGRRGGRAGRGPRRRHPLRGHRRGHRHPGGAPRKIFDRFHQAHQERRLGGMGLGLYISREIVEAARRDARVRGVQRGGDTHGGDRAPVGAVTGGRRQAAVARRACSWWTTTPPSASSSRWRSRATGTR